MSAPGCPSCGAALDEDYRCTACEIDEQAGAEEARRGPGRPPAGPGGERVRDMPKLTVRLPAAALQELRERAAAEGVSLNALVVELLG